MKKKTKILALSLALTALITQTIMAAAGNHKIQALKLNPFDNKKNDAMVVANGIKNNASGYTYSITNKTTGVTSFKMNGEEIAEKQIALNDSGGIYKIEIEM